MKRLIFPILNIQIMKGNKMIKHYHAKLQYFVKIYCQGKHFDSCKNSPCPYASYHGCQHPKHPKNQKDS